MGLFNKKKKESDEKGFNSLVVNVVVEKVLNGNLVQEVAEFKALQDKSESKSFIIQNPEMDFVEELDFSENEIIKNLKLTLELKNKTKEEKLRILKKSIEYQTIRFNRIKDGYLYEFDDNGKKVLDDEGKQKKTKVNYIDEERYLRFLQVLKEHVEDYDGNAVYEIINKEGYREIRFALIDDFLYPLMRSPNKKSIYRNMVTKKKVYKVKSDLNRQEFEEATLSKVMDFFKKVMPFLVIALFFANMFWNFKINARAEEFDDKERELATKYQKLLIEADERCTVANTKCSVFLTEFTKDNKDMISYANEQMRLLTEKMNQSIDVTTGRTNSLREQVVNQVINEVAQT